MKITKRQLRRIIREAMGDDFFSDREANPHDGSMYGEPEGGNWDDIRDSVAHVLWEKQTLSGLDLISAVQNEFDWGGAAPDRDEIFSVLDELVEDGEVIFNVEEDEWSLSDRGDYYDYMKGFKS